MPTIIKANQTGPLLNRLSTVDLADHLREAHEVITQAKRQAAAMIHEAHHATVTIHENARKEGYAEGFKQGSDEGNSRGHTEAFTEASKRFNQMHAHVVECMKTAAEKIETQKHELMIRARRDVLKFAIDLAKKMTFEIGALHRESAQANLERILKMVLAGTDVRISVNPIDLKTIETFAASMLQKASKFEHVMVVADDDLSPGGCVVAVGDANVDSSLTTQVSQMVSVLLGREDEG